MGKNEFPENHYATVAENYEIQIDYEGLKVNVNIWDLGAADHLEDYPADVYMICFDLAKPDSLDSVYGSWNTKIPEGKPKILVGTKSDRRADVSTDL